MSSTIDYTSCPFCNSKEFHQTINVKDYTVSDEKFDVMHCNKCTNRFTQNIATEAEIGRYYQSENYISHSDTQKGFISKLYHAVRNYTLKSKRNLVAKTTQNDKGILLDIGSGTGAFVNTMKLASWDVVGIEPDETARAKAKENYQLNLQPSSDLFLLENNSFDAVSMWHVMEHVHDVHGYFKRIYELLKLNGVAFIAVPNYTSFDASYYQQYWAGYDVPRHLSHFSPEGMKFLAEKHGFKIANTKPMWFDSVYVSMLSEQYKNGRSNFIKALFIGFLSNINALFSKNKCSSLIYILKKA